LMASGSQTSPHTPQPMHTSSLISGLNMRLVPACIGSGIIEIARRLSANQEASHRRLVFVAFAGEELGLLGSSHYVKAPPFPLESTVAMINLDMIGRLQDSKLTIGGTGSAAEFEALIEELNQKYSFKIAKMANGLGPSDHASFYRQKVPVLFFYTGDHPDYHKPTDDVERINVDGMVAITDFVTDIVARLDDAATRPSYRETTRGRRNPQEAARPFLGCVPDASRQEEGVGVLSVVADGPAAQAGRPAENRRLPGRGIRSGQTLAGRTLRRRHAYFRGKHPG